MTRFSGRSLGLFAILLGACVGSDDTQTISGRVDRGGFSGTVLGARVVTGDTVVATAPVDADGDFTLDVPRGTGYRLEVITSTGAQPLVTQSGGAIVHFDVCAPVDPYDLGDIFQGDAWPGCDDPTDPNCCLDADGNGICDDDPGDPGCDNPNPDGTCGGGTGGCDPSTGENCCDPATDPSCCVDADNDGNCDPPAGGCPDPTDPNCGCTDPNDPACNGGCTNPNPDGTCGDPTCTDADGDGICDDPNTPPPGCDPSTGTNCCDPTTDPNCCVDTDNDGNCDPPAGCENPNPDGTCGDPCPDADGDGLCDDGTPPGCDPSTGENCGCPDPNNDGTCDCPYEDPTLCWPPPDDQPCDANGVCDPGDCAVPEEEIPDFGCENW